MQGQHAHVRLTLCTGVGVSVGFALQIEHRAPELEIAQAILISPVPGEKQSLSCNRTTGTNSGLQQSRSYKAGSSNKDLPTPTHNPTAALPHTQLTCSVWGKTFQKLPGKTCKAKVISSQCLY